MKRYTLAFFLFFLFTFISCKMDVRKFPDNVSVCVTPNTMGDCHYTDNIYQGIIKSSLKNEFSTYLFDISSWKKYDRRVKDWGYYEDPLDTNSWIFVENCTRFATLLFSSYLQKKTEDINEPSVEHKSLFIFTDPYFLNFIHKIYNDERFSFLITEGKVSILLLDSPETEYEHVHTISFSSYAPYYIAGELTKKLLTPDDSVLSIIFTDNFQYYPYLEDSINAFEQGYYAGKTERVYLNQEYKSQLDDESEVFQMGQILYNYSEEIQNKAILPLCRGNIHGFLRYNREKKEKSFYTIGADLDMNKFSTQVPFSIEKKYDLAVEDWMEDYFNGSAPHHQNYTMKNGYVDIIISDSYKDKIDVNLNELKKIAIEMEVEYEKNK